MLLHLQANVPSPLTTEAEEAQAEKKRAYRKAKQEREKEKKKKNMEKKKMEEEEQAEKNRFLALSDREKVSADINSKIFISNFY